MHDFVDTYVKLLIAMISFVAPIMVLLLSVFNHGTIIVKKKYDEEKKQIKAILTAQLENQLATEGVSSGFKKFINNSSKKLNESENKIKKDLQLLNPKRQIIRMFIILFLALIFVMGDMLIRDMTLGWYNHKVSLTLLSVSGIFLIYAMFVLFQVGCVIIDTKTVMEEEKSAPQLSKENIGNNKIN